MPPPEDNGKDSELDLHGPGGLGFRAKGYRVMDLVCLLTAAGVVAGAYYIKGYAAEYENTAKGVRESTAKIAEALKESNAEVAKALRDSNAATVDAIRNLATEQRRSTTVLKEMSCLLDPAMKNRPDARESCKRLTRDDR